MEHHPKLEPEPEPEPPSGDALRMHFPCRDLVAAQPRELSPAASPFSSPDRERPAAVVDLAGDGGGEIAVRLRAAPLPPLEDWLAGLGASELLDPLRENEYDTGASLLRRRRRCFLPHPPHL